MQCKIYAVAMCSSTFLENRSKNQTTGILYIIVNCIVYCKIKIPLPYK
jgi:hypothetical protein